MKTSRQMTDELRARYQVGAGYVTAYLEYLAETHGIEISSVADLEALQPPHADWVETALSANRSTEGFHRWLGLDLTGRSFLDVGCGFGGRLVAAAAAGAIRCLGLERDDTVRALAEANCADFHLQAVLRPSGELAALKGPFDLIFCSNPSRQLTELDRDLRTLGSLLSPIGTLCVELVNPYAVTTVSGDPNCQVFAFSLLSREDAPAYHLALTEHPAHSGAYPSPWRCREILEEQGLDARTVAEDQTLDPVSIRQLVEHAMQRYAAFLSDDAPRLPAELRTKVDAHFRCWVGMLAEDLCRASTGELTTEWLLHKYLSPRWTVVARRQEEPAAHDSG